MARRAVFSALLCPIFIGAALSLPPSMASSASPVPVQGGCKNGVQVGSEIAPDGHLIIYCKHLGDVAVVSPSEELTPETRDLFERQVADLAARRKRAQRELDQVNRSGDLASGAAIYNNHVIQALSDDSVSDGLTVLSGLLWACGDSLPPEVAERIRMALGAAKLTANGIAAAGSEPGSDRERDKLWAMLSSVKDLLPVEPPQGVDRDTWAAIRTAVTVLPRLQALSKQVAAAPTDRGRIEQWARAMDAMVELSGRLPVVGTPISALHAAGDFVDARIAIWSLKRDAFDLREAGAGIQTARRYWVTRLGEIEAREDIYKTSLAGAGEPNLDDLPQ